MRRSALFLSGLILAALLGFLPPAQAQQAPDARFATVEAAELLRRGSQLETEHRWADALVHYEEAIRQYPDDRTLEQRFELARLHFDLARRYGDATFCDSARRMSLQESLDLYSDVLAKIHTHYVESPEWKQLVERGLNDLDMALGEAVFVERNVATARRAEVDALRRDLRRAIVPQNVQSRDDAREAAAMAATMTRDRLGVAPAPVVLEFLCGATNALDPYSGYLTAAQLAEVYSQIEGNFVGVGVELKPNNGSLLIVRVIPRSPAQQNGICVGDNIVAVGERATRDYPSDQAANLLQGEVGSTVDLTVASPGQAPRKLRIQRQRIDVPSIDEARIIDATRGIAYLKLVSFQKSTPRELDAALWQLYREGMRSLIVDVRGNPGGLLVAAVDVVDRFVEQGTIVATRGRNAQEDFVYTAHASGTWHVPLVVIQDQESASAAEIFAGAIRDHRRGTVVGVRSYGKGSVQGIFPLSFGNVGVRLTTAKFFSPAGRAYSRVGVEPDVVVYRVAKPLLGPGDPPANADDRMLTAALDAAAGPCQAQ